MKLRPLILSAISLTALSLISCGYQFQGSGSILPDDIKTVAIPVVENDTSESGLGLKFTEELRSRFERYGVLKVVDDRSSADAILNVRILGVDTRTRSVTGNTDQALEQDILMTISGELKRRNGQILWKNPLLQAAESFADVSDVVVTSSAQFAQSGISSGTLGDLGAREVSRGQKEQALQGLMEEMGRVLYLDAVAQDF